MPPAVRRAPGCLLLHSAWRSLPPPARAWHYSQHRVRGTASTDIRSIGTHIRMIGTRIRIIGTRIRIIGTHIPITSIVIRIIGTALRNIGTAWYCEC